MVLAILGRHRARARYVGLSVARGTRACLVPAVRHTAYIPLHTTPSPGLSLVWRSTSSPSLRTPHYSLSGNLQHYASPYLYFPHPYSTQINTTVGDLIAAATLAANSPVTLTNLR